MKFGLSQSTIGRIHTIFSRYPQLEKALLYGSRAKGNYRNGSDIDLTLCGGKDLTLKVLGKIMDDIDNLLLPYTMDLSLFDRIGDREVIEHIQRVGVTFYEKGQRRRMHGTRGRETHPA